MGRRTKRVRWWHSRPRAFGVRANEQYGLINRDSENKEILKSALPATGWSPEASRVPIITNQLALCVPSALLSRSAKINLAQGCQIETSDFPRRARTAPAVPFRSGPAVVGATPKPSPTPTSAPAMATATGHESAFGHDKEEWIDSCDTDRSSVLTCLSVPCRPCLCFLSSVLRAWSPLNDAAAYHPSAAPKTVNSGDVNMTLTMSVSGSVALRCGARVNKEAAQSLLVSDPVGLLR
jgi:hypothetical protein